MASTGIPDLAALEILGKKAMAIVRDVFHSGELKTQLKADKTKVTAADRGVHDMVLEWIKLRYPDLPIEGEEGARGIRSRKADEHWLLMDELDGTDALDQGIPTSVCMFALMRGDQPVISVIAEPFTNRIYTAEAGKGALMNGKPISVCAEVPAHPVVDVVTWPIIPGSPYNMLMRADKVAADLMNGGYQVQMIGSIGMAVARVASGEFHATVFPGWTLHDSAPGHLLVKEAGGMCTDLHGGQLYYDEDMVFGHIFAANKDLHGRIRKILRKYRDE